MAEGVVYCGIMTFSLVFRCFRGQIGGLLVCQPTAGHMYGHQPRHFVNNQLEDWWTGAWRHAANPSVLSAGHNGAESLRCWQSRMWSGNSPALHVSPQIRCCIQKSAAQVFSRPNTVWYIIINIPGLGHLTRSVSRVTAALSIASSVSHLFSFLVGCRGMISRGFGFVAFFVCMRASSFCIHVSCLIYSHPFPLWSVASCPIYNWIFQGVTYCRPVFIRILSTCSSNLVP